MFKTWNVFGGVLTIALIDDETVFDVNFRSWGTLKNVEMWDGEN